jgi:hypothetical protein
MCCLLALALCRPGKHHSLSNVLLQRVTCKQSVALAFAQSLSFSADSTLEVIELHTSCDSCAQRCAKGIMLLTLLCNCVMIETATNTVLVRTKSPLVSGAYHAQQHQTVAA